MSSSWASSSFSEPRLSFKYDIFLTFCDDFKDPARTFLENCLREAGFKTYTLVNPNIDVSRWEWAESCRIVVVVFTQEFVESNIRIWKIVLTLKEGHKTVLPFFYGVSYDEVRLQLESFCLQRFVNEANGQLDILHQRADAVCHSLYGFTLSHDLSDQETVSNLIAKAISQVGLQPRVNEVLYLSGWKTNRVENTIIVGIWGAGGIGKTTIVRAIYDAIGGYFDYKSFLANIKDVWENHNGRSLLQRQLSDIQVSIMKQEAYTSALIVLDDVNQVGQLIALCGNKEKFGKRSLILITTRNKDLLDHFVDKSYEVEKLAEIESVELFGWHAFKNDGPKINFENLSYKVIPLCKGLPLILEVIGSLLHKKKKSEWKKVLKKIENISSDHIQNMLEVSLDFLDDSRKKLFCDIACFHVGQSEQYVKHLFKGSKLPIEMGMQVLIDRSLIKIDCDKIYVHDLLQEIGKKITVSKPKFTYTYDVFLSFRGEDTRKSFVAHLYTTLKQAGIKVFMDDEGIARGEHISGSLLRAIESSRISIIIFSKNYAGSSWCLQELEKIMECYKTTGQEVFPIFYDVQPSEVRKQQNAFGKAWERLITRPSSSKGKKLTENLKRVLFEAASLSGWDMQNFRNEAELLDDVVKTITMRLDNNKYIFVAHHPVGLESRVQDIIHLLSSESSEVIIIGIWGMGGIGKTTMAKAIYNEMGQDFVGKSFLANIREVWMQNNGQIYLQEHLISSILKTRRIKLPNAGMGNSLIKETLRQKRVFLVLDDVNTEDQLKELCGNREWFGQGSRIIITTRDERLLQILKVDKVFSVREMDDDESLELFSWHAFRQALPEENFIEVSRKVVSYCRGLPLAVEILGSYLFDREITYWECTLNKLKRIPNGKIYEILKISYDGLSDQTEQELFLDICCFFIGKDRSYATQILDGCEFYAETGITHLMERSLVKVVKFGNKNILDMHDLLRDMGREIIREQSPEPEKRTRLWFNYDVLNVLENNMGTIAIKGLSLNMPRDNSICLTTESFKKMKRLYLLKFDHVQLNGAHCYLSKELRWLCWHGYLLENLPKDFNLEKTVVIDIKWSNLTEVWEKSQMLEWLKILNLSHSHFLKETPDFSKLPNVEKLILKDCPRLSMIHPSIGNLRRLAKLNLKNCNGLENLPRSIYDLKSLKTLNIFGCSKIERLDENIEKMESLKILLAGQTAITQVPRSLVTLKNIEYISICGHEGLSHDVFQSLVLSWMPPTNHSRSLYQSYGINPTLIKCLSHSLFSKSREIIKASISRSSQASSKKTPPMIGFREYVHKERPETFMSFITIHVGNPNKVVDILLKNISEGCAERGIGVNSLPRDNYPDWQSFKGEGSSISFEVPQIMGKSLKGFILCIIYMSPQGNMMPVYPIGVLVSNHTKGTIKLYQKDEITVSNGEDNWQEIISNLKPGNIVEVIVTFACELRVKSTAIYLVHDEDV